MPASSRIHQHMVKNKRVKHVRVVEMAEMISQPLLITAKPDTQCPRQRLSPSHTAEEF